MLLDHCSQRCSLNLHLMQSLPHCIEPMCLLQKSLGQCNAISGAAPGVPEGFCQQTCGRCTCTSGSTPSTASPNTPTTPSPSTNTPPTALTMPSPCTCTDNQPGSTYTCAQQKAFGKCGDSFVGGKGNCQITCGQCQCNPSCKCDDVQPPGSFTCAQQVRQTYPSTCITTQGTSLAALLSLALHLLQLHVLLHEIWIHALMANLHNASPPKQSSCETL